MLLHGASRDGGGNSTLASHTHSSRVTVTPVHTSQAREGALAGLTTLLTFTFLTGLGARVAGPPPAGQGSVSHCPVRLGIRGRAALVPVMKLGVASRESCARHARRLSAWRPVRSAATLTLGKHSGPLAGARQTEGCWVRGWDQQRDDPVVSVHVTLPLSLCLLPILHSGRGWVGPGGCLLGAVQ